MLMTLRKYCWLCFEAAISVFTIAYGNYYEMPIVTWAGIIGIIIFPWQVVMAFSNKTNATISN